MKKLAVALALAAALVAPASFARADIPQPVGAKRCPTGYVGVILWVNTAPTGYHEEWFCFQP